MKNVGVFDIIGLPYPKFVVQDDQGTRVALYANDTSRLVKGNTSQAVNSTVQYRQVQIYYALHPSLPNQAQPRSATVTETCQIFGQDFVL